MKKDWKKIATEKLIETSGTVAKTAGSFASNAKNYLDEKGITQTASDIGHTVDQHLSTLSGQKILDLVEERLALQMGYNDILASKLDEALTRINQLESDLKDLKKT